MASMKHSYASALVLLVAVLLSSSGGVVQGQNQNQAECLYDDAGVATLDTVPDGESGNYLRTYENICNKRSNGDVLEAPVAPITYAEGAPTFVTFCAFLEESGNSNVFDFIAKGRNQHTLFAPTDAAFARISNAGFTSIQVRKILQLHVLEETKLLIQLECDHFYLTLNTQNDKANRQQSKTKCLNGATTAQIGPGNVGNGLLPVIGNPTNVFRVEDFQLTQPDNFIIAANQDGEFSKDIVACNGIIHVVDNVLLPGHGNFISPSSKGGKSFGPPRRVGPPPQRGSSFFDRPFFGKGPKSGKSGKRRELGLLFDEEDEDYNYEGGDEEHDDDEDESSTTSIREKRRQRLLELLIEPDGDIAPLN